MGWDLLPIGKATLRKTTKCSCIDGGAFLSIEFRGRGKKAVQNLHIFRSIPIRTRNDSKENKNSNYSKTQITAKLKPAYRNKNTT